MIENREAIRVAVAGVLVNASNFPEKVQSRLLGQDMAPLIEKVVGAVMAVGHDPVQCPGCLSTLPGWHTIGCTELDNPSTTQ